MFCTLGLMYEFCHTNRKRIWPIKCSPCLNGQTANAEAVASFWRVSLRMEVKAQLPASAVGLSVLPQGIKDKKSFEELALASYLAIQVKLPTSRFLLQLNSATGRNKSPKSSAFHLVN